MKSLYLVVFGILMGLSYGHVPFRLYECETDPDRIVSLDNVVLDRIDVTIPGHVRSSGAATIHRPVEENLQLDVWVQKYFFINYFTIPCVSMVGSCTYDACSLLNWFLSRGCPWQLVASNFPCMCPFENGTYTMDPHPFYIPAVHGPWAWLAFGDFRVTGKLTDTQTNSVVGCYTVEFTVREARPTSIWDYWS